MTPIIPDTPSSVLHLLNADKTALNKFASSIIEDVKEGRESALQVELLVRKYEYVLDQIKKEIKENVKNEAEKYGSQPFEYAGAQVHLTTTKTEYNFDVCGDYDLAKINQEIKVLTEKKKKREEFLKSLSDTITLINEETGEVETISPPNKTQTTGVKVTLK